jgi:serine O-acetyltransferase
MALAAKQEEQLWQQLYSDAKHVVAEEPALAQHINTCVIRHGNFGTALACVLSGQLAMPHLPAEVINQLFTQILRSDATILDAAMSDLQAHVDRDPATLSYLTAFLYFKGFHALQVHRFAYRLWAEGRRELALYFQARGSQVYDVDIHPAAKMGTGIMIDHATGVVIGETAVVEDNVSMLHGVTLGGTGKECGDRHPKIRRGVLIGAGAKILGNIEVGEGAKIGAGSLVLEPVEAHTTVAGVPAKVIGSPMAESPALSMDQNIGG